jgi:hypothetical protein
MSVLELTKNAPKDEESSERAGLFSSLFSGDRDTGTKCELKFSESEGERIDRLAKEAEGELDRQGSSMGERHIVAGALISEVMRSKAFNWGLVSAVKEMLAGKSGATGKTKVSGIVNKSIDIIILCLIIVILTTGFAGTLVGGCAVMVMLYMVSLRGLTKITPLKALKCAVYPVICSIALILFFNNDIHGIISEVIWLIVIAALFYFFPYGAPYWNEEPTEESTVVTTREPKQYLIDKGVSEYALSVIKRCFDAGVISDSSFSAEAEDTARGDEIYKRVPERVRVSALLAVLRGDKGSLSLKAVERGVTA